MKQEEIEKHFDVCEFDDECDVCNDPKDGSYAVGLTNDENGQECDSYICGKCAPDAIKKIIEQHDKDVAYYESLIN